MVCVRLSEPLCYGSDFKGLMTLPNFIKNVKEANRRAAACERRMVYVHPAQPKVKTNVSPPFSFGLPPSLFPFTFLLLPSPACRFSQNLCEFLRLRGHGVVLQSVATSGLAHLPAQPRVRQKRC